MRFGYTQPRQRQASTLAHEVAQDAQPRHARSGTSSSSSSPSSPTSMSSASSFPSSSSSSMPSYFSPSSSSANAGEIDFGYSEKHDEGHQLPFMATSAGLGKVARKQGVRMRDAEIRDRIDNRWNNAKISKPQKGMQHDLHRSSDDYRRNDESESSSTSWHSTDESERDTLFGQMIRLASHAHDGTDSSGLSATPDRSGHDRELLRDYPRSYVMSSQDILEKDRYHLTDNDHSNDDDYSVSTAKYRAPMSLAQRIQDDSMRRTKVQDRIARDAARSIDIPARYHGSVAQDVATMRLSMQEGEVPTIYPSPPKPRDDTLQLLLPLLVLISTLLFLLILFIVLVVFVKRRTRIALSDGGGPLDVGREEELEGFGGLDGVEERWLETVDEPVRRGYQRAKDWTATYPPGSQSTEITLSQFLTIQEKGVSAWSFDPDYENNPSVFVEGRTEITFLADGQGMAPQEGGACSVQSNLPLPKLNEVYYWEAKLFTKPEGTNVAVGLATKPFPGFRMPGWSKYSVGFFSEDGFKCHNYPFAAQSYGPAFVQGDVVGVGYRPRNGTVFFTRNGKKLEDAFVGLNRYNLFPTVGADGAAEVHINLGQAGFVFIEANVKKWGLAPMVGTLGPPPPYGMERGSILIETGQGTSANQQQEGRSGSEDASRPSQRDTTPPPPPTPPSEAEGPSVGTSSSASAHPSRIRRHHQALSIGENPGDLTIQTGSTRHPDAQTSPERSVIDIRRSDSVSSVDEPHNPPTPHHLDISMHSLHEGLSEHEAREHSSARRRREGRQRQSHTGINIASYFPQLVSGNSSSHSADRRSPSPPPYLDSRHTWARNAAHHHPYGSEAGRGAQHDAVIRAPGFAAALFGALSERGLLTPLSARGDGDSNAYENTSGGFASHRRGPIALPTDSEQQQLQQQHNDASEQERQSRSRQGWIASWFS